eukprot:10565898-Karenia_brevis.AAC.1
MDSGNHSMSSKMMRSARRLEMFTKKVHRILEQAHPAKKFVARKQTGLIECEAQDLCHINVDDQHEEPVIWWQDHVLDGNHINKAQIKAKIAQSSKTKTPGMWSL